MRRGGRRRFNNILGMECFKSSYYVSGEGCGGKFCVLFCLFVCVNVCVYILFISVSGICILSGLVFWVCFLEFWI